MNKTKRYVSIIFMLVLAAMLSVNISTVKASDSPTNAASIWQFTDGFEGALWGRWSCWETPITNKYNRCGVMKGIPDWSIHTGAQGAIISTDGDKNSWSDIGTTVSLSPYQAGRTLNCVAQMYISFRTGPNSGITGQLEVIDPDTWTYVSIKPFTVVNDNIWWKTAITSSWVPPHKNVFVRIGLIGKSTSSSRVVQDLLVDDLTVQCQYY